MKLIDNYIAIKNRNNDSIVMIRSGVFYETFNDNAYIINYLFNYKIKKLSNCIMVGFPISIIGNIKEKLNNEQLNYVIADNGNNYRSNKNKDNNVKYEVLLDVSKKTYLIDTEIKDIQHKLDILKKSKSIDEILSKIKEII